MIFKKHGFLVEFHYGIGILKQEFWGPRKTWVKETPLPANLEEQPTVWEMFAILFSDIRKNHRTFFERAHVGTIMKGSTLQRILSKLYQRAFDFEIEHEKGEEKVAVWNRKKNEMEIRKTVYSPIREKIELVRGRVRRHMLNKFVLEDRFCKTLTRQQWLDSNFIPMDSKKFEFWNFDFIIRFAI